MSKKVEFVLNLSGLNELMKSQELQACLQQYGEEVAGRAQGMSGAEFGVRTHVADWVAITNVYPNSKEAAKDNYENNTLMKAVRG